MVHYQGFASNGNSPLSFYTFVFQQDNMDNFYLLPNEIMMDYCGRGLWNNNLRKSSNQTSSLWLSGSQRMSRMMEYYDDSFL